MTIASFVEGLDNSLSGDTAFDTDVFIVGTGPMGATTALLLAEYGVRATAISNYRWLANSPRAHITNQRAAEVFRDLGIEEELKRYAMPWENMEYTCIVSSLAGDELARIPSWGGGDRRGDYKLASPTEPMDLPQTYLEPVLVNNAASRGATVAFNTLYLKHEQDDEGVTVYLRDRLSGNEYTQRAKYLVGADGGSSQVAKNSNVQFVGERGKAGTVYARFKADLAEYVQHRPGVLTLVMHPESGLGDTGTGLLRCVRPWNEWIAGWGFDPRKDDPDLSDETALRHIRSMVGVEDLEVELLGTSVWYVNEEYAETMSADKVFIGGDAAHRHPPNNGLGSNTCVQDAYNLAWKLAYVVKGIASEDLLQTYTEERQPVAVQIVERANQSRADFAKLRKIFIDSQMPFSQILEDLRAPSTAGSELRSDLSDAVAQKKYEYQAHGVELNQRYRSGAVLPDGEAEAEVFAQDSQLFAQPTTRPGAKLPHVWLIDAEKNRVSTLDLVGKGKFTLITGLSGAAWEKAVASYGADWLRALVIGGPEAQDATGDWEQHREIPENGALLVRPDGYVAWRHTGEGLTADSQHLEILTTVLDEILGN